MRTLHSDTILRHSIQTRCSGTTLGQYTQTLHSLHYTPTLLPHYSHHHTPRSPTCILANSADFLCLNPPAMSKLLSELDAANLSPLPRYRETNHLPYLNVVIKEAIRLHAPVGVILERLVPAGGVTLCGHFLPEGTVVGCNPAVVHMDHRVYGRQYPVDEFRPERWLEASDDEKAEMERLFMAFGSGKRTCIGKNISLLEVYKLVPLLLMRFKVGSFPFSVGSDGSDGSGRFLLRFVLRFVLRFFQNHALRFMMRGADEDCLLVDVGGSQEEADHLEYLFCASKGPGHVYRVEVTSEVMGEVLSPGEERR